MLALTYVDDTNGALIVLQPAALAVFKRYCQRPGEPEAGGVLIGARRGEHFEITEASTPQVNDHASPTEFCRTEPGHQPPIDRAWEKSGGKVNYLGEWHTHPEGLPTPSQLDCESWREAATRHDDPLIMVIVTEQALYVAVQHRERLHPRASPVE